MILRFLIYLSSTMLLVLHLSCDNSPTNCEHDIKDSTITVRKPNIYIYPDSKINLSVSITFPLGGKVIESIPYYNTGWNVKVDVDGTIDNKYNYLYYECEVPDLFQTKEGWVVKQTDIKDFFKNNLAIHGFNFNEINDFIEFWIPLLNTSSYFEIYPQYNKTIERLININFSKEPANIYRLFYYIKERSDNNIKLIRPNIETSNRENFHVVEWGVMIK